MSLDMGAIAKVMDAAIERRVEPLRKENERLQLRVDELESREPTPGPRGEPGAPGKSVTVEDLREMIEGLQAKHALELERRATDYLERLEVRDGKDGIDGKDGMDGKHGMDGRDGKDADPAEVAKHLLPMMRKDAAELIERAVSEEVAKIPLPQDGKDGRDGLDGKDGADGLNGKDGAPGDKGMDGRDGKDVTMDMVEAAVTKLIEPFTARLELDMERRSMEWRDRFSDEIRRMVDSWPRPKDGRDGAGIADFDIEYDGERGLKIKQRTADGEIVVRELQMPIPLYREVWKTAVQYAKHDMVTHDGSTWIALEDSKGVRPGHMQKAWKLIVKRGRDGK